MMILFNTQTHTHTYMRVLVAGLVSGKRGGDNKYHPRPKTRVSVIPDDVFLLEDYPHDWFFRQCAAVVHHGGAGTTATGLKAGIYHLGVGPRPIPISEVTVKALLNAINFMLQPEVSNHYFKISKILIYEKLRYCKIGISIG
ncbi:hypothetical protein LXL04_037761 [Taraxacum kok-saghyz]